MNDADCFPGECKGPTPWFSGPKLDLSGIDQNPHADSRLVPPTALEEATALLAEAAEVLRKFPTAERANRNGAWYVERAQPALKLIEEFLA